MLEEIDKILMWLLIAGVASSFIVLALRSIPAVAKFFHLGKNVPALLFAGVINLLVALAVYAYFTKVTLIGLVLAFAVVVMVSHYVYKIVIQRFREKFGPAGG